jgi:hypothetical protein
MTALVINDLPVGKDLDRAAMASITGGRGGRRRCHGRKQRQDVDIRDNVFKNKGDVTIVVIQGDVTAGDDINFG